MVRRRDPRSVPDSKKRKATTARSCQRRSAAVQMVLRKIPKFLTELRWSAEGDPRRSDGEGCDRLKGAIPDGDSDGPPEEIGSVQARGTQMVVLKKEIPGRSDSKKGKKRLRQAVERSDRQQRRWSRQKKRRSRGRSGRQGKATATGWQERRAATQMVHEDRGAFGGDSDGPPEGDSEDVRTAEEGDCDGAGRGRLATQVFRQKGRSRGVQKESDCDGLAEAILAATQMVRRTEAFRRKTQIIVQKRRRSRGVPETQMVLKEIRRSDSRKARRAGRGGDPGSDSDGPLEGDPRGAF
jgi:hypothetical protein